MNRTVSSAVIVRQTSGKTSRALAGLGYRKSCNGQLQENLYRWAATVTGNPVSAPLQEILRQACIVLSLYCSSKHASIEREQRAQLQRAGLGGKWDSEEQNP